MSTAAELSQRLDEGWQLITAEPDPDRRDYLERFWLELLRKYELQCRLEALAPLARMEMAS